MNAKAPKPSSDTGSEEVVGMYKKGTKIYPRKVKGLFANLRIAGVLSLLGLFYILPWITMDGRQAVLLDLPERKFYIFNITFWPQDFFYLAIILIIAALSLFFFTALAGRLWCGYACPQTVWTEVFLWIEQKIEGDRPKQMKLDKGAWTQDKIRKKVLKHTIWVLFSLFTGFTFVGYFTPLNELASSFASFSMGPWETFWVFFYGFATYGNAGWLREQVCVYMCPYARFQSAMFDRDTLIIAYDERRGEPRGRRSKKADPAELNLGSCIDCTLCVQVCPTGIDIREGLQYQCIGCAACIDVCDDVMEKMGYEKGLIKYTSEHAMEGETTHVVRPRMMVYGALLLSIIIALGVAIAQRTPLVLDIIRDRNALYRENDQGLIENVYTLKILNMDTVDHEYELKIDGIEDIKLNGETRIKVESGGIYEKVVSLAVDPIYLKSPSSEVMFHIKSLNNDEIYQEEDTRFLGPVIK